MDADTVGLTTDHCQQDSRTLGISRQCSIVQSIAANKQLPQPKSCIPVFISSLTSRAVNGSNRRQHSGPTARPAQIQRSTVSTVNRRASVSSSRDELHPSIYLLNATSLKKPHAIQHLCTDILRSNIDIVFITETWLSSKQNSINFEIPGYKLHRRDRFRRVGGGVCIYLRDTFNTVEFSARSVAQSHEALWSHCIIDNVHYFRACCYYPPKPKHTAQQFISHLSDTLDYIMRSFNDPYFIVAGDFNNLDTTFLSTDHGLLPVVATSTHGNRILDKIFVSWPSTCTVKTMQSS